MYIQIATIDFANSAGGYEMGEISNAIKNLGYEIVMDGGFNTDVYYIIKKTDGE